MTAGYLRSFETGDVDHGRATALGVLTQVPSLASALHLEPLHADDWAIAALGSLMVGVFPLLFDYARSTRRRVS